MPVQSSPRLMSSRNRSTGSAAARCSASSTRADDLQFVVRPEQVTQQHLRIRIVLNGEDARRFGVAHTKREVKPNCKTKRGYPGGDPLPTRRKKGYERDRTEASTLPGLTNNDKKVQNCVGRRFEQRLSEEKRRLRTASEAARAPRGRGYPRPHPTPSPPSGRPQSASRRI